MWYDRLRYQKAQRTWRWEPKAETDVCWLEFTAWSLEGYCRKKALRPAEKRELVDHARQEHGLSIRKACTAISISRSVYHYQPDISKDDAVISAIQEIPERYPAYGFNKVFTKLRRAGHPWNHKCVYRVLCIEAEPSAQREETVAKPKPWAVSSSCWSESMLVDRFYVWQPFLRQTVQNI